MSVNVREKLYKVLKFTLVSTVCVFASAAIGLIYGLIIERLFTLQYVFPAVFVIGAVVVFIGVVVTLLPVRPKMKDSKLVDHTNYAQVTMERREKKRKTSHLTIYLGVSIIMIAAIIQWILSLLVR